MNPDDNEKDLFQEWQRFNQLYASDENRADELKAIKEKIENATSDEERAQLFREALLELYAKNGLLTKQGEKDLEMVTPVEHHNGEVVYVEDPLMNENWEVTHKRR